METIYMEQPSLPVIVISAHEKFEFAKKSLRFGAKDYLVKPLEQHELLRVVSKVLLEKKQHGEQSLERSIKDHSDEKAAGIDRFNELLIELVTEKTLTKNNYDELLIELKKRDKSLQFGVVTVRLDLTKGGFSDREIRLQDRKLLKYATLNIMEESLRDWNGIVLNGFGNELIGIVPLDYEDVMDQGLSVSSQFHLIGQSLNINMKQYLNVEATVGLSTLHSDVLMLPKLLEEAKAAIEWRKLHPSQKLFYYEDVAKQENLNMVEWLAKVDEYIQYLRTNVDQKPSFDSFQMIRTLNEIGHTDEMINSYLGMLVYRIYGVLLEFGGGHGILLHKYDPEIYFQGMTPTEKLQRLHDYMAEAAEFVNVMEKERNQSLLSRITGYIRMHYNNPELKIQDIANEVHFSTAYLGYVFKREMGKNIWDFVTELRIEEAKHLLSTTDKKQYEVAYAVGYESPEHFSRMFKRYTGISPAEYRKEGQGGSA